MAEIPTINDQQLNDAVALVQDGDSSAYEVVVRRFEKTVRTWLAVHSPPGVDVDEIAQRSFVAAFSRIDEFRAGTNFGAWLTTIARYQLKTETTRLRRIADYHTRYAPDLLSRELELRSESSNENESVRLEHLKACLGQTGEHLLRFVRWRYEEEIPLQEMANRCERSVAAVKKQLWKIRRMLHQCVESRMDSGDSSRLANGGTP
ncbi:MAG: sigma-70 family RNA polymerase sigma factor [Planctomycetota bacterium]